jgi:quinol monooxygenase YgiN
MNSNLLTVVATLYAKPGKEDALKQALLGLVEPTRAEGPCVQYDLHESIETPGVFVFYENWESKEALDLHLAMPYLQALAARGDELFAQAPDIRLYRRIA